MKARQAEKIIKQIFSRRKITVRRRHQFRKAIRRVSIDRKCELIVSGSRLANRHESTVSKRVAELWANPELALQPPTGEQHG